MHDSQELVLDTRVPIFPLPTYLPTFMLVPHPLIIVQRSSNAIIYSNLAPLHDQKPCAKSV